MRVLALLALLATLALAACGGAQAPAEGSGAAFAPASAHLFATVRTDADDDQYEAAVALLEQFPAGEKLLREADPEAFGPTLDVVVLADDRAVLLARPDDRERLDELLARHPGDHVVREVDGWTLVAERESDLDLFERERARGTLEDDDDFRAALGGLPEDAVAHVFHRGDGEGPAWLGAAAVAEGDGLRLEGRTAPRPDSPEPAESELLPLAPAGVLAFVSFGGDADRAERLPQEVQDVLRSVLGVEAEELAPLLAGEGALWVARGGLIPEATLVLTPDDVDAALELLDETAGREGRVERERIDGLDARRASAGPLPLLYAGSDGRVVVSTSPRGLVSPGGEGQRLPDDPLFAEAAEAAALPEETTGITYLNVRDGRGVLQLLGALGGGRAADALQNLEPVRSVLLHGAADRFGGFATIR